MEKEVIEKILATKLRILGKTEVSVIGISMNPILYDGDVVTIAQKNQYDIGDILVFKYKNDELLIHRLLKIEKERYYLKGDNAFRLEDVSFEKILGCVTEIEREKQKIPLPQFTPQLIEMSLAVVKSFRKCKYDTENARQTSEYCLYKNTIKGRFVMLYQKNKDLEYIFPDDISLVIFDPESGKSHFLDETCVDIMNELSEPINLENILIKLCEIYQCTPEEISKDVEEFLEEMIEKKVVIVI